LTEGEIRTLPSDRQLVFAPGLHPILAHKAPYFRDRHWQALAKMRTPDTPGERVEVPNPWGFTGVQSVSPAGAGEKKSRSEREKLRWHATKEVTPAKEAGRSKGKER